MDIVTIVVISIGLVVWLVTWFMLSKYGLGMGERESYPPSFLAVLFGITSSLLVYFIWTTMFPAPKKLPY